MRGGEVRAARIGDGRNPHLPLLPRERCDSLEPLHPCGTKRLGIRHDVGLGHRNEISGAEIFPDLDLMLDGPLNRRAELARPHCLLLVCEPHPGLLSLRP
jgi:hypothetical protein